jgi:flagellar motility protein MotE (MotC chaperone)
MKKILGVLVLTLAINFLIVLGGVGWLMSSGHLDRDKIARIKDVLFPTSAPTSQPTSQPAAIDPASTQPAAQLDRLLARVSGRPAIEQVEFIQTTFDQQMAIVDRRQRELIDLQRQIDIARAKLERDRASLAADRKALTDRQAAAAKAANDEGFQNSLQIYSAMKPKQVKAVFATMQDDDVARYLQALPTKLASKIIAEFKTPDELDRIKKIMDQIRSGAVSTTEN